MGTNARPGRAKAIADGGWSISSQDYFERDVLLLVSGRELAPPSNSFSIAEENISVQLSAYCSTIERLE